MPSRSSTRTGPGARWRSASTKRSPAARSGRSPRPSAAQRARLQPAARAPRGSSASPPRCGPGARRAVVVGVVQERMSPPRDAGGAATCDRLRARPPSPIPPPPRPQHRPPAAAADRPQADAAEDPVGRAVVGDRLAARLLDRGPRPLASSRSVTGTAAAGCGGGGSAARRGGRRRRSRPPGQGGARPARRRGRRSPWPRPRAGTPRWAASPVGGAVVEGERDPVGPVLAGQDSQRRADAGTTGASAGPA